MRHRFVALVLTIALAGCAGVSEKAGLTGSEWRPVRLGVSPVPKKPAAFVQFRVEGRLAGQGGCNSFMGTYKLEADTIAIGPLASTQMACPDPAMGLDREFTSALQRAKTFRRNKGQLTLFDVKGREIAKLSQTDRD